MRQATVKLSECPDTFAEMAKEQAIIDLIHLFATFPVLLKKFAALSQSARHNVMNELRGYIRHFVPSAEVTARQQTVDRAEMMLRTAKLNSGNIRGLVLECYVHHFLSIRLKGDVLKRAVQVWVDGIQVEPREPNLDFGCACEGKAEFHECKGSIRDLFGRRRENLTPQLKLLMNLACRLPKVNWSSTCCVPMLMETSVAQLVLSQKAKKLNGEDAKALKRIIPLGRDEIPTLANEAPTQRPYTWKL